MSRSRSHYVFTRRNQDKSFGEFKEVQVYNPKDDTCITHYQSSSPFDESVSHLKKAIFSNSKKEFRSGLSKVKSFLTYKIAFILSRKSEYNRRI